MPGALAAARNRARATRLQARHRELASSLADVEAELDGLGFAVPERERLIDDALYQADRERIRADKAEAEAANLRGENADLRARLAEREAAPPVDAPPEGAGWHGWARERSANLGREFARLHEAGVSGVEIARRYGISDGTVYARLRAAGYHAGPGRGHAAAERRAEARRMVAAGRSKREVAEHFGVTVRLVRRWLNHPERPLPAPKPRRPRPCKRDGCPLGADQARDQAAPERAA